MSDASPPASKYRSWIAAGLFLLVLVFTNPPPARHQAAFRSAVRRDMPLASLLGAGRIASWLTEYHSIGIASFSTLDGTVVTFGAMGYVWAGE